MAKSFVFVVLALFIALAASQCNVKTLSEYVPKYDDFTSVIDYDQSVMTFTWGNTNYTGFAEELGYPTLFPCSRVDYIQFQVTVYTDKTLTGGTVTRPNPWVLGLPHPPAQRISNIPVCSTFVTAVRFGYEFEIPDYTAWGTVTHGNTHVTLPSMPPTFTASLNAGDSTTHYSVSLTFATPASDKCGCAGLLERAYYEVQFEQRGNITIQETAQTTNLTQIPDENGDIIVTTYTVCEYFVSGGTIEVVSADAHVERLHINPIDDTISEEDETPTAAPTTTPTTTSTSSASSLFISAALVIAAFVFAL